MTKEEIEMDEEALRKRQQDKERKPKSLGKQRGNARPPDRYSKRKATPQEEEAAPSDGKEVVFADRDQKIDIIIRSGRAPSSQRTGGNDRSQNK